MRDYLIFIPELYTLAVALVFLVLAMARPDHRRDQTVAVLAAGVGVLVCLTGVFFRGELFFDTYRVDLFSQVFKVMLLTGLFFVLVMCKELEGVAESFRSEFYLLLFVCTLSMMMLVSSVHLLTVYVALELSSYSLYILVFLRKERELGAPAGIQYFLMGATASAIMLFGLAFLYAAAGSAYLSELIRVLPGIIDQPWVTLGLLMTLCGFFFKLALFPFHFWAPVAYYAAPNQTAAYIATASKVAAIGVLVRFTAFGAGSEYLVHVLVVLSVASMTVGNLAALVQKDFKKLLAYSSVAHAGYVLIGVVSLSPEGYASVLYYAAAVLVMKFTCFLVLIQASPDGGNLPLSGLAGLHRRSPLLAMALMLALFGLAGIPPTIGFTAKLLVFLAAMDKGLLVLVIIAMINVTVSLYYYLLVVKAAYLDEPPETPAPLTLSLPVRTLTIVLVVLTVLGGIYPNPLMNLARDAAAALM